MSDQEDKTVFPIALVGYNGLPVSEHEAVGILNAVVQEHLDKHSPESRRKAGLVLASIVAGLFEGMDPSELEAAVAEDPHTANLALNGLQRLTGAIAGPYNNQLLMEHSASIKRL